MVRKNLKLYLFLLITAAVTFFLFGEQLLHPQPKQPHITTPTTPQPKYNVINEVEHHIEGNIIFGTVLQSATDAKTTILGLANRLIEGFKVNNAEDKLTLAVFDVFGIFEEFEVDLVEDEKRIKILIFPMKKSYDPCLLLTNKEVSTKIIFSKLFKKLTHTAVDGSRLANNTKLPAIFIIYCRFYCSAS